MRLQFNLIIVVFFVVCSACQNLSAQCAARIDAQDDFLEELRTKVDEKNFGRKHSQFILSYQQKDYYALGSFKSKSKFFIAKFIDKIIQEKRICLLEMTTSFPYRMMFTNQVFKLKSKDVLRIVNRMWRKTHEEEKRMSEEEKNAFLIKSNKFFF